MNWHWLLEILEEAMPREDIVLANPFKTRIIAEAQIKPDKVDARMLVDLLRGNLRSLGVSVHNRTRLSEVISFPLDEPQHCLRDFAPRTLPRPRSHVVQRVRRPSHTQCPCHPF